MKAFPFLCAAVVVAMHGLANPAWAADASTVTHFYDETGMRHLSLQPLTGGQVEVRVRWASSPGASGVWLGQGTRKEGQLVFAAVVEEGQDRGTYFIAKGESKLEIQFRPNQKMPQDPGILGVYRHVSDEKRLQLARKEFGRRGPPGTGDQNRIAHLAFAGPGGGGGLESTLACTARPLDEDRLSTCDSGGTEARIPAVG